MTVMAWEHLVNNVMPRIEAEQQLAAAMAAAVPHMTEDGRRETLGRWQEAAATMVRQVARSTLSQVERLRRFFRHSGINPDTGQEDARFG